MDRETCAKYKRALDELLPAEWSEVVYSKNASDIVDRPTCMSFSCPTTARKRCGASSRKPNNSPRSLIVTDKLLTGYDAPILYAMYPRQADA